MLGLLSNDRIITYRFMAGTFAPILPQKALKTKRFPAFFDLSCLKIPLPKCVTYFSSITKPLL